LTLCQLLSIVQRMSYITERRGEEKERRRAEILDAAEALYARKGWDGLTVDEVARSARLSRALVYVYFRDKEELLFAIGERALGLLRDRFVAAAAGFRRGIDQVEAIGKAYMDYAIEFPHYFDFCSRFHAHSVAIDPGSHEGACQVAGDEAIGAVIQAIEVGKRDGSIRPDVGESALLATTLWAFTHGVIQLAMAKGDDLARFGITMPEFSHYALGLMRNVAESATAGAHTPATRRATATQRASAVKPATATQRTSAVKPATAAQRASAVKPASAAKRATVIKPATAVKPLAAVKPAG
jgi:AcrR family transcriptional regulator